MFPIQSQLILQSIEPNSVKDPFEISKRYFKSYKELAYLTLWSEKYQAEIECIDEHGLLQTSDIQLNIYLKPETQIEFHEKIISYHGKTFQKSYGIPSKMICKGRDTSSKFAYIFKFCC